MQGVRSCRTHERKTPIFITIRENGNEISGYRNGFPVDGGALHPRAAVRKRAEALIVSDPSVLATAPTLQKVLSRPARLNEAYDEALARYRAENRLDAKGFSRGPKKKVHPGIEFVPVHPGMAG